MASDSGLKFVPGFSVPVGVLLAIFFFLPWVSFRCEAPEGLPMQDGEKKVKEMMVASGWELTTGSASPGKDEDKPEEFKKQINEQEDGKEFPKARPWFAVGLAVPVLLVVIGLAGLMGAVNARTVGRVMVLLGIAGLVIGLVGLTVDYADEAISMKEKESVDSLNQPASQEEVKEAMREALQTKATPWLWLTIVLHAGVALVGTVGAVVTPAPRGEWE